MCVWVCEGVLAHVCLPAASECVFIFVVHCAQANLTGWVKLTTEPDEMAERPQFTPPAGAQPSVFPRGQQVH